MPFPALISLLVISIVLDHYCKRHRCWLIGMFVKKCFFFISVSECLGSWNGCLHARNRLCFSNQVATFIDRVRLQPHNISSKITFIIKQSVSFLVPLTCNVCIPMSDYFFLRFNCLFGPFNSTVSKYKERTNNNIKCFIQHGFMPFRFSYCLSW